MPNLKRFPNILNKVDVSAEANFQLPITSAERKQMDDMDRMATERALGTTGIYAASPKEIQLTSEGLADF